MLSLSAVKLSSLLLLYSLHPTVNVALEIVYQEGKGFFCKMERTQFTQYILGKVFAPPPTLIQNMFSHKEHLPLLTRNLQRRCDSRKSVVQNAVCVPMEVVTWLREVLNLLVAVPS